MSADDFAGLPDAPVPAVREPRGAPPYHEDAERSVLSAMMLLDARGAAIARQLLTAEDFYREAHRRVFRVLCDAADTGRPSDVLSLATALDARGELASVGGKDYLADLLDAAPTGAQLRHHATLVREFARRRQIIVACHEAITAATEGRTPVRDIVQAATATLVPFAVDDVMHAGFRRVDTWPVLTHIEGRMKGEIPLGYATGIRGLDAETSGYRPGQLVFVGAVAKGGKSVVAHQIAVHHALQGYGAGIVSAEMETSVVVERMLNAWSGVPARATRAGRLRDADVTRLVETGGMLNRAKLWVDDAARPSWADVRTRILGLKAEHPEVNLVVVDFLQLVRYEMKGRRGDEELTALAYDLKGLAKQLGLILIVPCQLNYKDVEKRPDKRPELQDLQGSSGMVQAADQVILLYRAQMYFPDQPPTIELIVPAGGTRISPAFTVTAWWRGDTMRIANDPIDPPVPHPTQLDLAPSDAS